MFDDFLTNRSRSSAVTTRNYSIILIITVITYVVDMSTEHQHQLGLQTSLRRHLQRHSVVCFVHDERERVRDCICSFTDQFRSSFVLCVLLA